MKKRKERMVKRGDGDASQKECQQRVGTERHILCYSVALGLIGKVTLFVGLNYDTSHP